MNALNSLIHVLTLHCDVASELASREIDEPLRLIDRLALHGHLISCRGCREFRHQIRKLHEAISGGGADQARTPSDCRNPFTGSSRKD